MAMTEETIYQAIREVCNTDNPQVFAEMNKTVFDVAKRALELAESGWAGNAGAPAGRHASRRKYTDTEAAVNGYHNYGDGLASLELGIGADDDFFKSLEPDESLFLQIRRK